MASGDTRKVILENKDGEYLIPFTEVASSTTVGRVKPDGTTTSVDANGVISVIGKQDTISDLATIRSGAAAGATAAQPGDIGNAEIEIQKNGTKVDSFTTNQSGSKKTVNITVPTKISDLTNDSGFISGITSSDVTTALGYTPYNSSNPSGYQANVIETVKVNGTALTPSSKAVDITVPAAQVNSDWNASSGIAQILNKPSLATVATTGAYSDLSGTPTIPTVNNATLTITQGGTTKGTFTANAGTDVTIALDAGSGSVDVDNKSITTNASSQIQTVGVINSRDNSTAIKTWTGTKAQYDGILSKDANTLYNTDNGLFLGTTQVASLSSVRNIGEIIQSTIPLTDAGLHLLDGSLISGSGSYADFVTYIASLVSSYPDCFCSEADWQTSVINYGACDKFVYDTVNDTVRLPKRSTTHGKLIKSYSSGTGWYRIYSDGWCEQGDSKVPSQSSWKTITLSIPFTSTNYQVLVSCNGNANGTSTWTSNVDGQAYSNSQIQIKGTNAGEQWLMSWRACGYVDITDLQQNPVYEYIVIATSVKTEIEVDIDEVMTDLNGKADVDLSNCTKPHIVETYVNGTSWYRIWSDGWIEQGGELDVSSGSSVVLQKPFTSTSYSVLTGSYDKHSPDDKNYAVVQWRDKQTTGFTLQAALNGNFYTTTVDWYACGY